MRQIARPSGDVRRWCRGADLYAGAVLSLLIAIVAWNRFTYDGWLSRHDLLTLFLPLYTFLGDRLRDGDIPGWNPHLFSGTPFAGDPQSGWMYLPPMVFFPFLAAVPALKAMIALQLAIAGLATYAFARVLGMWAVPSLVAAVVFTFGPLLHHSTYCCTVRSQISPWIPLTLLGVELSLRASRWRDRAAPWCLAGFAISQMFAGWLGQGVMNALLVVASYIAFRALLSPPDAAGDRPPRARLVVGVVTGLAVLGLGLALGAAGLLPRLAINSETLLAGGDYDALPIAYQGQPYALDTLLWHLLGDSYDNRAVHLGGGAIILALLAPVIAGRRFAVPYFTGMTLVVLTLSLGETPLHRLFYLIPRSQDIHEHYPPQVNAVVMIGPAILSAATVQAIADRSGRRRVLPFIGVPLLFVLVVTAVLAEQGMPVHWPPLAAAMAVTALLGIAVATPAPARWRSTGRRLVGVVPLLILAVAVLQPTGVEIVGSVTGHPLDPEWATYWEPSDTTERAIDTNLARSDPNGAGAFLQDQLATSGPFRYAGYAGLGHPEDTGTGSYEDRREEPAIQALLVSGRPVFLDLYSLQGFNPNQLSRYADFMAAVNGRPQDYHVANILPSGVGSPLLDLLNLQYILVDARLPADRDDVAVLTAGRHEVFRTEHVVIYARDFGLPHAWIVHDVRSVAHGDALPLWMQGGIDLRQTALIEGSSPHVQPAADPAGDSARVVRYEADAIDIVTTTDAPGLLVVSEIYETGWEAFVDGERVDILPTDHALRGIPIPAGERTVELRYAPDSLRLGLAISTITAVAMAVTVVVVAWDRIRQRAAEG